MPPKASNNKAKRGRKPAQKIVANRPNQNVSAAENDENTDEEDEADYLLKFELIELVQGYPEIYDIACPGHKKEVMRNNVWQQISKALFLPGDTLKYQVTLNCYVKKKRCCCVINETICTVDTCKKMWQNLRDPYPKMELARNVGGPATSETSKKSGTGSVSVAEKASSWAFYDKMSFLKPYIYAKQ